MDNCTQDEIERYLATYGNEHAMLGAAINMLRSLLVDADDAELQRELFAEWRAENE